MIIFLVVIVSASQYASSHIPSLKGCVNDAKAFKTFLNGRLCVPDSQIVLLMNKNATRKAILAAFYKHLMRNDDICEGDTIIFYHAGHGSRVTAPDGWAATDGKIETLCPYDDGMIDESG